MWSKFCKTVCNCNCNNLNWIKKPSATFHTYQARLSAWHAYEEEEKEEEDKEEDWRETEKEREEDEAERGEQDD